MSTEEALALIVSEASADGDGLLSSVRRGEEPGSERMRRLISALGIVFHSLEGQGALDRGLAAALFALGSEVPLTISSWANKGHVWRRDFMGDEVYELLMRVQSIFDDRRLEPGQVETIH
ncbi:MAG TPA: hypothetical protein VF553_03205 [Pyrinomonadaceae bacterium]|jgi:hypothetical protein